MWNPNDNRSWWQHCRVEQCCMNMYMSRGSNCCIKTIHVFILCCAHLCFNIVSIAAASGVIANDCENESQFDSLSNYVLINAVCAIFTVLIIATTIVLRKSRFDSQFILFEITVAILIIACVGFAISNIYGCVLFHRNLDCAHSLIGSFAIATFLPINTLFAVVYLLLRIYILSDSEYY